MATNYTSSWIAWPFLRISNSVVSFINNENEIINISIADLGLASAASIILFEENSEITFNGINIDATAYTTGTPTADDYITFFDNTDSIWYKATISDTISTLTAPLDASYVVLSSSSSLTNESVLAAGSGITLVGSTLSADYSAVQAKDATLTSIAGLGTGSDKTLYTTGVDTWAETGLTSYGRSLIDDSDAATARSTLGLETMATQSAASVNISGGSITGITDIAIADGGTGASNITDARTNLGLVIGTDIQAYDSELAALASVTSAADALPYFTGAGTAATTTITTFGRSLIDDADNTAARTTLGLGTLATQNGTVSGTNTGDQNLFSIISVSGQSDVVADSATDTLTLIAGTNITITTDATTDSITINSSGGGGGLSDGDYGDITVSGSSTVLTIDNNVVTYAKMQDISTTARLLGRKTAGSGDTEEVSLSETLDFIGSAAHGDILYRGTSSWSRLGTGTSGQVLTSQGTAANLTWSSISSGDWVKISSATASSSAAIEFTGLSSTYRSYVVIIENLQPGTASSKFWLRTSTDNGSSYDQGVSDYAWQETFVTMTVIPVVNNNGDNADSKIMLSDASLSTTANFVSSYFVYFQNTASAIYQDILWQGKTINGSSHAKLNGAGVRLTAADITAIRFLMNSGNIATGEFTLYGIKA